MRITGGFLRSAVILVLISVLWQATTLVILPLTTNGILEFRNDQARRVVFLFGGVFLNIIGIIFWSFEVVAIYNRSWFAFAQGWLCYAAVGVLVFFVLVVCQITYEKEDQSAIYNP